MPSLINPNSGVSPLALGVRPLWRVPPPVGIDAAAPAFANAGAVSLFSGTALNVAVPVGVTTGDVILIFIYLDPSTDTVSVVPAGFTQDISSPVTSVITGGASGNTSERWAVYWKRASGNDSGTYNFTLASTPTFGEGVAFRYTGCIQSGVPIEVSNVAGNSTVDVNFVATSVNTNGADRLLVWAGGFWDNAFGCTQPAGFTVNLADGSGAGYCVASKVQPNAGPTGLLTASLIAGQTDAKAAWLGSLLGVGAVTSVNRNINNAPNWRAANW